ncbi:hypothetical protein HKX48_001226 [Thoreauomyces humboldtii]|nr:hypothetical protein HKX48_001226 [Thoreauomyces humboldtii]
MTLPDIPPSAQAEPSTSTLTSTPPSTRSTPSTKSALQEPEPLAAIHDEEALLLREESPSGFFMTMADPAVVLDARDNLMVQANHAFVKHLCASYHGRSFTRNLLHPDDIRTFAGLLARFRKPPMEGASPRVMHDPIRCKIQTLSLSADLPRYVSYEWSIAQDPETRNLYMTGRAIDEPIREISMAAEFADFFNHAPIALHWLSAEGIVLWANQTELDFLGYTAAEYFNHPITDFCVDEPQVVEIFKTLGSGNTIHDVQVRMRHKDGTIKNVLIDSNVNYHSDGSFNHTRCFIRDDTARKLKEGQLKLELESAQAMIVSKENIFSSIAHDLRTPMQALLGTVQLLLSTDLTFDQHEYADTIFSSGAELCTMLDNIVDAMRSTSAVPLKIDLKPMDLKTEIESIIKRMSVLIHGKDILLSLSWHGSTMGLVPSHVIGDSQHFKRILINLIGNAIKVNVAEALTSDQLLTIEFQFTEKGFIIVSVKYDQADPDGLCFKFAVSDTGKGISQEDLPQVFKQYWQKAVQPADGSPEVLGVLGVGGAGLGLSISAMSVKAMGGTIGVESDPTSMLKGSTFWFKLPMQVVPDARRATRSSSTLRPHKHQSREVKLPSRVLSNGSERGRDSDGNPRFSPAVDDGLSHTSISAPRSRESHSHESSLHELHASGSNVLPRSSSSSLTSHSLDDLAVAAGGYHPAHVPDVTLSLDSHRSGPQTRSTSHLPEESPTTVMNTRCTSAIDTSTFGSQMPAMDTFHRQKPRTQRQQSNEFYRPPRGAAVPTQPPPQPGYFDQGREQYRGPMTQPHLPEQLIRIPRDSPHTPYPQHQHQQLQYQHPHQYNHDRSYDNLQLSQYSQHPPNCRGCSYCQPTSGGYSNPHPTPTTTVSPDGPSLPDVNHGYGSETEASPFDCRSEASSTVSRVRNSVDLQQLHLRILAAEDNPLCQKVLQQILRKCACEVVVAANGIECIREWEENKDGYDAILMDIRMPEMDGITATRILRERGCSIPIMAVTAERGDAERQKCLLVGMNSFLSKPLMINDLVARLRDLCT